MKGTYGKLMELNQPVQAENKVAHEPKSQRANSPILEEKPKEKETTPRYRDTKQP